MYSEVPNHLKKGVGFDAVVMKSKPKGACFYNAGAASENTYNDANKSPELRKNAHEHLTDNWEFYKQFIDLPFVENVGVGDEMWTRNFKTHDMH